jgi:zinc transporter ZupT
VSNSVIFALSLGLIFGVLFFIVDIYNEQKTKEINTSLIAGITITYFFVILLPEIENRLGDFSFPLFKFIGILAGFCAIHLTEKFILLRVERDSQIKLKEIFKEEEEFLAKEKNTEKTLINQIIGNDKKKNFYIKIAERLFALREVSKIQDIIFAQEKNIEEKLTIPNGNNLAILNKLAALKQISKMHRKFVEEERKLQRSLSNKLLPIDKGDSFVGDLLVKLNMLKELRKEEEKFLEIERNLENFLIKILMNNHQNQDKLTKEEFSLKFSELKNISKVHEDCVEREDDLEKTMLNDLKVDYIGGDQEFRLVGQVCALQEIVKIQEVCYLEEKKLEEDIIEGEIDKLSILLKLSALKEVSKIRSLYIGEEERLRKLFKDTLQESKHTQLSNEYFMQNINSYEKISEVQKEAIVKERSLENFLINGLMENNENKISLIELTEKLIELKDTSKIQADCIAKEKMLGASVISEVMENGQNRLTLNQLASKLNRYCQQEEELEVQSYSFKVRIQNHINERLDTLHLYTNFVYHLIIGILLFDLLLHNYFMGVLFFVFAFFKALTSKTSNDIVLFPGIEVNEESSTPLYLKVITASAALIGVFIGLLLNEVFHTSMELIFFLFSFISGVILYTIIREVLPENESGRPLYFILGILIFLVIVLILESIPSVFIG